MEFPGIWMTESRSLIYRVVPKCACSTIGQVMHASEVGAFFDGDIHQTPPGVLLKWGREEDRPAITDAVIHQDAAVFTCVRNPYRRVVSGFFDKIASLQQNGKPYRNVVLAPLLKEYGLQDAKPGGNPDFDQIAAFRRFLLMIRDGMRDKTNARDIHWSPMIQHVGTLIANGGRYDAVLFTESLIADLNPLLAQAELVHPVDLTTLPRFNETGIAGPRPAHPVADFYDDLAQHLMAEMFAQDFDLFGYDIDDPAKALPKGPMDLDRLHATVQRRKREQIAAD